MNYYEEIYKQLPEAAILTDKLQRIEALNNKAEEILGVSEEEAQGAYFSELVKCPQIFSLLEETLAFSRPPNLTYENSTVVFHTKGKKKFFKVSMVPLNTLNETKFVLTTLTDITMLKEIEQFRTDFFATASHEYRTPLTSILMGVGIIKTGQLGELSTRGEEILEAIEEDCARLLRLADNMLDLSRMETGSITLELEYTNVYKIVKAALGTLQLQAEKRNIKLYTKLAPDLPLIKADINKIIWVLTNLVGNALRYTGEGGSITVRAIRKGTRLFFSVKDTGKGISPEYHGKIFQKFIQIKDDDFPSGGAGLGLTICKEIVEAHGGEIWVKSEVGKGATFTFSIPLSRS
jgi:two-component system, NtrC family, sensor histidine kinase KinB